ncbi:MAG: hypothetical protein WC494_03960 [Candidatus Pacearchaeota archaeon]
MLRSKKNVFWEALLITILIFLAGFLFGVYIEGRNFDTISDYSTNSEINLLDGMILVQMSEELDLGCDFLKEENIEFADRIYEEAKLLEKYEEAGKITESMRILHRKYSLLRTFAWKSNSNVIDKCDNYDLLVYLYEYEPDSLDVRATQAVWSNKLTDIKKDNPNMVLLPIAVNQGLSSLDILLEEYGVESFPAVVVNNKDILYNLDNFDL